MHRALLVGLLLAGPALAETREEYQYRKMLESLQGEWGVRNMAVAGKMADPAALRQMRYRVEEDRLIKANEPEESARLNIDLSGPVPKVEYLDRHGITMLGIMQRRGNSLVVCLVEAGEGPPKEFKSTPDNKAILIELTPAGR